MSTGGTTFATQATVIDPASSVVTNGPFGPVATIQQEAAGAFTALGPYARELAVNSIGTTMAVIDNDVLSVGSGLVPSKS